MLLRIWRMRTAASAVPRTKAGMSMRCRLASGLSQRGTNPEAGSQPSRTEKNRISMIPSQKLGTETPQSDTPLARRSHRVLRRTAASTPAGMAMPTAMRIAKAASWIVMGSFFATVPVTDARVRMDSPRSPRSANPSQRRYWTGTGSFNPYFSRISSSPAASASVPAMTRAGSPGIMRTPVKTMRRSPTASRPRSRPAGPGSRTRATTGSVPGRVLDPDQAVGHGLVAPEILGIRHDVVQVIEVHDVAPAACELLDRVPVERGTLAEVADLARLVQERVDGLLAHEGRVQAATAGVELMDVGVGVHAPAPADQERLELAGVIVLEGRGELRGPQRDAEASLLGHALQHLSHPTLLGIVDDRHLEAVAAGEAGIGQQLLGPRHVAARALPALVIERAHRRDGSAADRVLALPGHLVQGLTIDREVERLADARVVGERRSEVSRRARLAVLVPDIEREARVADARDARHFEPAFLLQAGGLGRSDEVHHVDVPRPEIREPHVVVGDDAEDDPLEPRLVRLEVVGRLLQHDAVLRHALDELPGPDAHGRRAELVLELPGLGGRDGHARAVGQDRHERREGCLEADPHRQRIHGFDGADGVQLAAAVGALHVLVPVQGKPDRLRRHRRAVVELDAGAQLDGHGPAPVRVRGQPGGQLRVDTEVLVDLVELLAHLREDDPPQVGPGQGRVEDVGVLVEGNDQRLLLGVRGARLQREHGKDPHAEPQALPDPAHRSSPPAERPVWRPAPCRAPEGRRPSVAP